MTQSIIHASVKTETVFPQTDFLNSFNCLEWKSKQSDCLQRPRFLRSPLYLLKLCDMKSESPRYGAGTAVMKQSKEYKD